MRSDRIDRSGRFEGRQMASLSPSRDPPRDGNGCTAGDCLAALFSCVEQGAAFAGAREVGTLSVAPAAPGCGYFLTANFVVS